jgi:hypothetical protein
MAQIDRSGFFEFDRVLELARRTRHLLDAVVREGELPDGGADVLADETLPHLETVQAGFRGWLRAEGIDLAELQYLLLQLGTARVVAGTTEADRRAAEAEADAEDRFARAAGRDPAALRSAEPWDLAALAHARLVLAVLPRLEAEDVRWPGGRATYADIPAPRGPAELADRLDELERLLWRTATGRAAHPSDPALRRTYGFFDAAERLGERGLGLVA